MKIARGDLMKNMTFEDYHSKRVSYILATKNRAEKLEKSLEICKKFLTQEDELIVIDGGSTDTTQEIVKKYADSIDLFISEQDRNCTHAANKGILLSRGKYIKALSDDDDFYPKEIKKVIEIFEKNPNIDLLLCGGSTIKNGKISYTYVPPGVNYGTDIKHFFQYPRSGHSQFFRKKSLALIGMYPWSSTRPDGEIMYRFFKEKLVVRFCRINAFRHYSESHQGIIKTSQEMRKERNNFLFSVAKESTSASFYWKYRLITLIQGSCLLRILRKFRRITMRKIYTLPRTVYVWDGGLS